MSLGAGDLSWSLSGLMTLPHGNPIWRASTSEVIDSMSADSGIVLLLLFTFLDFLIVVI